MPNFNKIASVKSGNCDMNNFLPVRCNKGRSVTFIHYVQSISRNKIKQGLTSANIRISPGGVMRISIAADDWVSFFSPAASHQPLQLPGVWGFNIIVWKVRRSENNLPRTLPHDVLILTSVRSLEH
jgi:hypothetical protein